MSDSTSILIQRTYDVVIPDSACINNDDVGARMFRQQLGVDIPGISSWDHSRCKNCVPSCQENSVCDYKGHGMCICPNSNQVGPNCGSMGTIQFDTRDSDLVYDAVEPPIGFTRVETIRESDPSTTRSPTTSPMSVEYRSTPSIWTVLISLWIRFSASTDGTIHTTIESLKDTCKMVISQFAFQSQTTTELATQSRKFVWVWQSPPPYDIQDYQIENNTQATVRIQPFGGYIQFDKSVVSLSESSESISTDECDLVVQRLNGKGGDSSAVIKLITISDAGEGNVCSETTANDLNLNDDLNLDSPYFNLTWSDQDDSDRCLNFDVVDDTIVEGDEVICAHIERVGGTARFPRQETPTLFSL